MSARQRLELGQYSAADRRSERPHSRQDCTLQKRKERACKPGSVRESPRAAAIPLRLALPPRVERPTRGFAPLARGRMGHPPLFGLAHDEVCHATPVAGRAVGSYPAFSPLPPEPRGIRRRYVFCGTFCPAPALAAGAIGIANHPRRRSVAVPDVIRHRARLSPDFPRPRLSAEPRQRGPLSITSFRHAQTAQPIARPTRPDAHSSASSGKSSLAKAPLRPEDFLPEPKSFS